MGMTTKIDRETGEISEEVSEEEFKEIMRAWKARRVRTRNLRRSGGVENHHSTL
jgi:hypothetical protein